MTAIVLCMLLVLGPVVPGWTQVGPCKATAPRAHTVCSMARGCTATCCAAALAVPAGELARCASRLSVQAGPLSGLGTAALRDPQSVRIAGAVTHLAGRPLLKAASTSRGPPSTDTLPQA